MCFRQRWLEGEVSSSLTALLKLVIGVAGFTVGFLSCKLMVMRESLGLEMS